MGLLLGAHIHASTKWKEDFRSITHQVTSLADLRQAQEVHPYKPKRLGYRRVLTMLQMLYNTPLLLTKIGSLHMLMTLCFLSRSPSSSLWPTTTIWKSKAPLTVKCFISTLADGRCLTWDNLQRRGIQLCNKYIICKEEAEGVNHLFLHCKIASLLSNVVLNFIKIKKMVYVMFKFNYGSSKCLAKERHGQISSYCSNRMMDH